jgi:glycosyltransferase involved in cell wall biosynthesis
MLPQINDNQFCRFSECVDQALRPAVPLGEVADAALHTRTIRFSIIVPVYEHWHHVPALLEALERQSWSGEFEVLLVDNGSEPREYPELPSFARILRCGQAGSYAARNAGIAAARGEWLVFTDADCIPDVDWLTAFDQAIDLGDGKPALYAGRVQVWPLDSVRPNPWQIYDMVKGIPQRHYVRRGYGATANLCVSRQIIDRIGAFDARRFSGGDAELCLRARDHGYSLGYVAEASVVHRRLQYLIRTFLPPFIAIARFLSQHEHPWRYRMVAAAIQLRIWLVDMREALRLGIGATPERR